MEEMMDRLARRMQAVLRAYDKVKVATAESCTGGLVAKMLTDYDGASYFFESGVVAYTPEMKHKLLGVPLELIEEHGVVSQEVADAMAEGACRVTGASYGIGITGIAGPGGATRQHKVGTVFLSVYNGKEYSRMKQDTGESDYVTSREFNREYAARSAISMLCDMVENDYGKVEGYEDDYLRK